MGNRTPQSKSFNTVKHSNRDTRIKKQQKQRLLILAMAAVIALLLVMLLILSVCTIAQKIKNVVDSNNPDLQGVGTTLEEGNGMTVLSEHYKTKGPLLIVNSLGQSNSYIPDESLMTVIAKGAQPTFNGAPVYKLSKDLKIHPDALEAFNAMMTEYCKILWSGEDTVGTSPVELKTAYRSLTEQESLNSSTKAGFSDHHTGYLLFLDATAQAKDWIDKNAYKYGFVLRYPSDKSLQTGISNYTECIRYVGVAHASYMKANNLCLEEYVDLLRQHPFEAPLQFSMANGSSYIVYYAAAYTTGGANNLTHIKTPKDYTVESVSGDNVGGFIVTVKLN